MMESKDCFGGCLLSLVGAWIGLWILVRVIDLCRRLPVFGEIADGFIFTVGFAVYVIILGLSNVVAGVKMVFQ